MVKKKEDGALEFDDVEYTTDGNQLYDHDGDTNLLKVKIMDATDDANEVNGGKKNMTLVQALKISQTCMLVAIGVNNGYYGSLRYGASKIPFSHCPYSNRSLVHSVDLVRINFFERAD